MGEMDHGNGGGIQHVSIAEARYIAESIWSKHPEYAMFWYAGSGIGKSAVAEQMVKEGEGFFPIYAHSFNPTESNGIPYVNDKTGLVEFAKLGCLPLPKEKGDPESGVICIEEINLAPPSIQAELMKLIFARVSGNYRVPEGYRILACSNRARDKAAVNPIPYPLRIRWFWFYIEPDLECWIRDFALQYGIDPSILAFLKSHPKSFCTDPPPPDGPGASPRTWTMANAALECGLHKHIDPEVGMAMLFRAAILGAVGALAGAEYLTYREVYDQLPGDMKAVALGHEQWLPDRDDLGLVYAAIYNFIHIYRQLKGKEERLKVAATSYKLGKHLGKEMFLPLLMECWKVDKKPFQEAVNPDTGNPFYRDWASDLARYIR